MEFFGGKEDRLVAKKKVQKVKKVDKTGAEQ
jgi:hypothetical protein